jgi:hypothetical protein
MILKLHVINGLNVARQLKISFLYFAVYNSNVVTSFLNYTVYTSDPVVKLSCTCVLNIISVNCVYFVPVL